MKYIEEFFYFSSKLLLVFIVLDVFLSNIVSSYFNLNILLLVWFILFLIIITNKKYEIRKIFKS